MQWIILIVGLLVLTETSILVFARFKPKLSASKRKIYVDSSALIDGRIIGIAKTGFIDGDFIIPRTVLLELQLLADSKDSDKRNIGRIGLDNASELERVININTEILDDTGGLKKVDEELLKLAKESKGTIITMDYNLIKVATAERIETLNINDLSLAVRIEFSVGDRLKVKILEKGSNPGQGVGHLSNGTMVVVENATKKIGQEIEVVVARQHETSSGQIVFAKIARAKK